MKSILIADDEIDIVEILKELFEENGFNVVTAADGADALQKAQSARFDLICTDFQMPRLNGVKLITALREQDLNKTTPIIVLTGHIDEARSRCQENPDNKGLHFQVKPFEFEGLVGLAKRLT